MSFPSPAAFPPSVPGPANNAIVPNNAPIQPAQAFVTYAATALATSQSLAVVNQTNKGWTSVLSLLQRMYDEIGQLSKVDLTGNALTDVDQILAFYATNRGAGVADVPATIYLSGGTNAEPTGGAVNANIWLMVTSGTPDSWEVKFNLHGVAVSYDQSTETYNLSGNSMSVSEVNTLLAYVKANYLAKAGVLNVSGGTSAAPTGQGITDKAALIAGGWTVTTN